MPIPSTITELRETEKLRALQHIRSLPSLRRADIKDSELCCPICLISFGTIFEDEELVCSRQGSSQPTSSSQPIGLASLYGVVKLAVCGHAFCRKDIAEWVDSFHGSCPACRQVFYEFTPIDEAEYESSDGGEYLPDDEEFEEDEFYTDDDLIPSSDFLDTDVEIDDEDEIEVAFAIDERNGSEGPGVQGVSGSSVYGDVSDAEPEDDEMPRITFLSDDYVPELDGGMSSENDASPYASEGLVTDGSTSLSSDGPSFEMRHNDNDDESEYAADVSMVSADIGVQEDCITNIEPIISKEQNSPSLAIPFAI